MGTIDGNNVRDIGFIGQSKIHPQTSSRFFLTYTRVSLSWQLAGSRTEIGSQADTRTMNSLVRRLASIYE